MNLSQKYYRSQICIQILQIPCYTDFLWKYKREKRFEMQYWTKSQLNEKLQNYIPYLSSSKSILTFFKLETLVKLENAYFNVKGEFPIFAKGFLSC